MYKKASLFVLASSAAGVLGQYTYGNNSVPVLRDSKEITEAHFPEPEVELHAPAFLTGYDNAKDFNNGTAGPTSDETLIKFMREYVDKNEWASYHELSEVSEETRDIPYLILSNDKSVHEESFSSGKVKVWIQGGQHGNEPAGDQAVLAFIGLMENDPEYASKLLEVIDFLILPRYNIDGVNYFQRILPSYHDPNRDHIKLWSWQTQKIKCLANKFGAHVSVDMHEFGATTGRQTENGITPSQDALYAAAKNLNIDSRIRTMSEEVFATRIGSELKDNGFRGHAYFTYSEDSPNLYTEAGGDAIIGRNAYGLSQAISFLTETRGIGIADDHFKRRTAVGLSMVKSIVDAACDNSDKLYTLIEDARKNLGTPASMTSDIVLADSQPVSKQKLQFINMNDTSLQELEIEWATATPAEANGTVSQPAAYIIPAAWVQVAKRLQGLGVYVKKMEEAWSGEVETYTIESAQADSEYYEGVFRYAVTTSTGKRQISLPKNSYVVPANQPNAAFAFIALEPESTASYVTYNIIPVSKGDEYPIFRIPKGKHSGFDFDGEQYEAPTECILV